jgi:Tetracyclin repressor-like, C-terminal domain
VPTRLRPELPELLWLYFMGIVLFWVHDPTPDNSGTRTVLERTAPLVVRVIGLSRLPVMRSMIDDIVALVTEIRLLFPTPPAG